jgi:hypothetical protein
VKLALLLLVMLVSALPAVAAAQPASSPDDGMRRVVELARGGEFAAALAHAESFPNRTERAQSKLYVLHQAGDLTGAIRAGIEGLQAAPSDPWLLERVAYIALSLRALEIAREHVDRLARVLESKDIAGDERGRWLALLAEERAQLEVLNATAIQRVTAARRARWTVAVGMLSLAIAMIALAARQRRSRGAHGRP